VRQPFRKSTGKNGPRQELSETTAAMVMTTRLITVQEEMLIEEAIGLMAEKALKRLPVVDEEGRFKGMISRDSLLRTGFAGSV
jgi:CBS domain-containing protein